MNIYNLVDDEILHTPPRNEEDIDYEKWFLSSYTKDPSYSFQKGWRIVFTEDMGGNKQSFPFVKSIILGEKISVDSKKILVDLANKKGFEIYQRKLNASGAKIILRKL